MMAVKCQTLLLQICAFVIVQNLTVSCDETSTELTPTNNVTQATEAISEVENGNGGKQSKKIATGVLASYLQGVGQETLSNVNRPRTTRAPPTRPTPPPPPPSPQILPGHFWNVHNAPTTEHPTLPPPQHQLTSQDNYGEQQQSFPQNQGNGGDLPLGGFPQNQGNGGDRPFGGFPQQGGVVHRPLGEFSQNQGAGASGFLPPIPTSVPLISEDQKLAYKLLQMLQEKEHLEKLQQQQHRFQRPQFQQQTIVTRFPQTTPFYVRPTTDPDYYDYDPDYVDKTTTTTTTPAPTRRRRRKSTTSPPFSTSGGFQPAPNHQQLGLPPMQQYFQQQNFHPSQFKQTTTSDYDIDYLDVTTKRTTTTTTTTQPPPPPPTLPPPQQHNFVGAGLGGIPQQQVNMTPEQFQQLLLLQRLQYFMTLQKLQQYNQFQVNEPLTTTESSYSYYAKLPGGILKDPHIAPTMIPTSTENPADPVHSIAGIFGSLAVGNLAGIVDNSLKLGQTGVFDNLSSWTGCLRGNCGEEGGQENPEVIVETTTTSKPIRKPLQDRYPGFPG